jgi:hypothetical protein
MMNRMWVAICVSLFCFCSAVHASRDLVAEMLDVGQTVAVVPQGGGETVLFAIGRSAQSGQANQDREKARAFAYDELAAFLKGTNVGSSTSIRLEASDRGSSESFLSQVRTEASAFLRGIEVYRSGSFRGDVFVVLKASSRATRFSAEISAGMASNEVVSTGSGSMQSGLERARRTALEEALRNAVAQFSGVSSASRASVTDADILRSQVSSRSKGVVSKYRVLEERQEGDSFTIRIAAIVTEETARTSEQVVQAIKDNLGRPGFFIVGAAPTVRTHIEAILRSGNYDIVSDRSSARFVLTVASGFEEFPSIGGLRGRRTNLELRLFDTVSSQQLEVVVADPSKTVEVSENPHAREATSLRYAFEDVKDRFLKLVSAQLVDQFNNGARVQIKLDGFDRMRMVDVFHDLLKDLPGVRSVSMRPIVGNSVVFDVFYAGDPGELQLGALRNAERFRLFGLKIRNRDFEGISFTLANK